MKAHILLLLIILGSVQACEKSDTGTLYGRWRLTEVLADPGDGSGKWQKPAKKAYVTFNRDGSVSGDGLGNVESFVIKDGSKIEVRLKGSSDVRIWTYKLDGKTLEISLMCIEPCGQRFKRDN